MNRLLEKLQLAKSELARLMMVPKTTLQSWIERKTNIPDQYKPYTEALEKYLDHLDAHMLEHTAQQLDQVIPPPSISALQRRKEILQNRLHQVDLKLNTLKIQKHQYIQHLHLAQNLNKHFDDDFPLLEALQEWQKLIERKSAYQLKYKFLPQMTVLEIEQSGIALQIAQIDALLAPNTPE